MGKMEKLPTIDDICRHELHLDKFIQEQLKAEIMIFRRAYEKSEGVYVTSEAMMDSTSPGIERMTAKFLEHEIVKHQNSGKQKVSAGEHFWDPAQGYVLDFPSDKEDISKGLNRLFAKQNRYRIRNLTTRGDQQKKRPRPAAPSVEASDLPDVDELLRTRAPGASQQDREGVAPQTRSGRPYNNDLPIVDANLAGVDIPHPPPAAPVVTMTQDPNWGYYADHEIESKPLVDLSSNATRPTPVETSKVAARDTPAQHILGTTSQHDEHHADATSQERTSNSFVTFNQGLENATAPNSGMAEREIKDAIESAMLQLNPTQAENDPQEQGSKKRAHPEQVGQTKETLLDLEAQATKGDVPRDKAPEPDYRAAKRPKGDNKIECATRASEISKVSAQAKTKVTTPRHEKPESPQVAHPDTSGRPTPDIHRNETEPGFAQVVDKSSEDRGHLNPTDKIHTDPELMFQAPHLNRTPSKIKACLSHGVRAHTLPPDLDEIIIANSKTQESSATASGLRGNKGPRGPSASPKDALHTYVAGQRNVISDSHLHDLSLKIAPADGIIDGLEAHNEREMSQTLEPEPIGERAVPATPPPEGNDPLSPSRRTRVVVQFWILQARVPRMAWKQWADASLSAQTVTTVFQAVDEHSRFRSVKAADVKFQTDEQLWTYSIKEDDPDHFDDMKRFITATIKAALRKNRNNNRDFMVYIEPIGVEEIPDEETAGEAEDEMIPGL